MCLLFFFVFLCVLLGFVFGGSLVSLLPCITRYEEDVGFMGGFLDINGFGFLGLLWFFVYIWFTIELECFGYFWCICFCVSLYVI